MSLVRVDTGALLTMVGEAEGSATDESPFGSSIEKIGNTPETGVRDELRGIRESLPEDNCNIRDLTTIGTRLLITRTRCGTESTRIMQLRGCVHNIVNTSVEADATAAETITAIMTDIYNQATVLGSEATSNMQADKFADYSGVLDLAVGIRNGEFSVDEYIKYAGSNDKVNDVSTVLNSYLDSLSADEQEKLFGDMSRQEWVNSKIDEAMTINQDFNNAGHSSDAYDKAKSRGLTINETRNPDWFDNPVALTKSMGVNQGPSGKETYYNLKMSGVVDIMRDMGFSEEEYPYWVREDGVKMLGDYVMVAADLDKRPRGTLVESSLGMAIVCDTGGFVNSNPWQLDIAVTW